jgi:hypothetical protein
VAFVIPMPEESDFMKKIYLILATLLPFIGSAQYVFNATGQNVKFGGPGVTIIQKVGTGTTAGSVTLYQNVVNIGGQQIDAIIRTVSVSSGATMIFDQAGTGTGYTNNNATWFSPQFNFPTGGGNAVFEFEFILGNSFNNTTNTGTSVTLQDMYINSYDIDGNDNAGSNQFTEFGGFTTSEVSTTTTTTATYNASTNLTRFGSSIYTNVVDASDPNTRVRVNYEKMSLFRISVGALGAGVAYFFIDFDKGVDFTTPTKVTTSPSADLNTSSSGNGNSSSQCSSSNTKFTSGGSNIISTSSTPSSGTTLERIRVTFTTSDIKDGSAEKLIINGALSGSSIQLNFSNGASLNNVSLSGTIYAVSAVVSGSESSLIFTKNSSSTMTLAEGEKLIDAFYYGNTASSRTNGTRTFEVRFKDGAYESVAYNYAVSVGTTPTISQQPSGKVIAVNASTSFTTSTNATNYQWQVNPGTGVWSDVSNGGVYSGATTNTLAITNAPTTMNNYQFRAIATNSTPCSATTNAATLSVLAILPVKWLNVTGAVQNDVIAIKWGTAQEISTESFTIQVSTDGKNFKNIGEVTAAGNANENTYYSFIHTQPSSGNNYYRIMQTDADGKITYSKIIMIVFGDVASVTVLGNPVGNGQLTLQVNQTTSLKLFSADGKLVKMQQASNGTQTMDVRGLAKGMYTLLAGTNAKRIIINN